MSWNEEEERWLMDEGRFIIPTAKYTQYLAHLQLEEAARMNNVMQKARSVAVRGEAKIVRGEVVLDRESGEEYFLTGLENVALDLAAIMVPTRKVPLISFVRRYGLLTPNKEGREPISLWEDTIGGLRDLLTIYMLLRRFVGGDDQARGELEQFLQQVHGMKEFMARYKGAQPFSCENQALRFLSYRLAEGIKGLSMSTQPDFSALEMPGDEANSSSSASTGFIMFSAWAPDLLTFVHLQLARMFQQNLPINLCPGCGRFFIVLHKSMVYCKPPCGNRARLRKYAAKRRQESVDSNDLSEDLENEHSIA